jgi:branched-chain amino acid transport system substrate-binding protein
MRFLDYMRFLFFVIPAKVGIYMGMTICLMVFLSFSDPVQADTHKDTIKIGDISAYSIGASFANPVKYNAKMAIDEINAAGGVCLTENDCRPLEVIHEDDKGSPSDSLQTLERLVSSDGVTIITGCPLANVSKAISNYAKRQKIIYALACPESDDLHWKNGHDYMIQAGGPTIWTYNKVMAERAIERLGSDEPTRWVSIGHNYEWGQTNVAAFKSHIAELQPNAVWVDEHWPAIGKINAGAVVQAILRKKPDAIYSPLWGSDLSEFIREGKKRGLFKDRLFVADVIGRPEIFDEMGSEAPEGTVVITMDKNTVGPIMLDYGNRYQRLYNEPPRLTGAYTYHTIYMIKTALEKAGTMDPEVVAKAFKGLEAETIFGAVKIREIDNVSTNGVWVGETGFDENNQPIIRNIEYKVGSDYLPSDDWILQQRGNK